jgi:hypothetical protein
MTNGSRVLQAQILRVAAVAVTTAGLIAVLTWLGIADFKIDAAIVCVAVLVGAYLMGKRRLG